ncbi:hypothetical protein Droror1_Dr00020710 [Drosera rotundifolia]
MLSSPALTSSSSPKASAATSSSSSRSPSNSSKGTEGTSSPSATEVASDGWYSILRYKDMLNLSSGFSSRSLKNSSYSLFIFSVSTLPLVGCSSTSMFKDLSFQDLGFPRFCWRFYS